MRTTLVWPPDRGGVDRSERRRRRTDRRRRRARAAHAARRDSHATQAACTAVQRSGPELVDVDGAKLHERVDDRRGVAGGCKVEHRHAEHR
jgi:hypothetical protein